MKLRHLKIFETVARYGNVTSAAQALSMTQPAVSMCLKQLEQYCGQVFLVRTNRGVKLTSEGDRFLRSVRGLLADVDRLESRFQVGGSMPRNDRLMIGGSNTLSVTTLPEVIVAFKTVRPHASLNLVTNYSRLIEADIANGKIDIGLVTSSGDFNSGCTYRPFKEHEAIAFVRPEHPLSGKTVTLAELRRYPLAARRGSTSIAALQRSGNAINFTSLCDDPETVKELVRDSDAVGILFRTRVELEISMAELCRVQIPDLSEVVARSFVIYSAQRPLSDTGKAFLDLLSAMKHRLP